MTDWAITANLGGTFASSDAKASTLRWADATLAREPAIVFAQEIPSEAWLKRWDAADYQILLGEDRGWKVRSALITRNDLRVAGLSATDFTTLHYHGSYVAAGRWTTALGDVVLVSVHASPNPTQPVTYGWRGPTPKPRAGGGDPRYAPNTLWDSDLLLETLSLIAASVPVLAAGDFNEARGFDIDVHGIVLGSWGREFFDRVWARGFQTWLSDAWGQEFPTYGRLQLDHLLATEAAANLLAANPAPHLDQAWATTETSSGRLDHAPIWFALNPAWFEDA